MIESTNAFPYNEYNDFYTSLPKEIIIEDSDFDFFIKKYYQFTADFYLIDKNKKYLYPSSFMNNENIVWISEVIDEIKDFITFCRNTVILH